MQTDGSGGNPEFGDSPQIPVKPEHFAWLSKQCEVLGTSKQELIANVLQEWVPRNSHILSALSAAAVVEMALSDFICRHRDEFITVDDLEKDGT